jgi:DASS family divalent anion:Na+ symporter
MDVARLLNFSVRRSVDAGQPLFREGEQSKTAYWIEQGEIELSRNNMALSRKCSGFIGLDGVVGYEQYAETAVASATTVVYAFPKDCLDRLSQNNVAILKNFFSEHQNRHLPVQARVPQGTGAVAANAAPKRAPYWAQLGWILLIAAPMLIVLIGQQAGIDQKILYFAAILTDAVLMWIFDLVPVFVPPLFSILLIILFDVAPPKVALSGFSTGTFFMCLSIFGISALMIKSGLAYRLSLNLLILVPAHRNWYGFILFFIGVLLTPVVPSRNGRTSIVGPFLIEILGMIKADKNDPRATQFISSALQGVTLMSPIFLTGSSLNLILYGMFDEQLRYTYQGMYWTLAASASGLMLFVAFIFLSALYFRSAAPVFISKDLVREQRKIIGPMSGVEKVTLLTVLALMILIPSLKVHKVEIPWLLMTISTSLLIFGIIGQKEFRNEIDWPILIFIGAILAWTPVISMIGLNAIITSSLSGVAAFMKNDFYWFVAMLAGAQMIARLFLPVEAAVILFATIVLPIATGAGMSPWPIAFVLLTMSEATLFPYQNLLRLQIDGMLADQKLGTVVDEGTYFRFNLITIALRLAVIYASIPFWKFLNVL